MGWRLGGKGASGRGIADRVEEHGLHLWMGFYENAFRLMRDCYAERHAAFPNCRFADWRTRSSRRLMSAWPIARGAGWEFWLAHFQPGQGQPGDPPDANSPFTVLALSPPVGDADRRVAAFRKRDGIGPSASLVRGPRRTVVHGPRGGRRSRRRSRRCSATVSSRRPPRSSRPATSCGRRSTRSSRSCFAKAPPCRCG